MAPFFDLHGDPTMDPYTILGIPATASEAEIKRSYRMQMLQLHPDKLSPNLSEADIAEISDKFHNVKDAYEFLTSPLHLASRRLYMTKMASRRAEYERREAYMRRNNNGGADSRTSGGGIPSGYSMGGGGTAGMAGSGMPTNTTESHQRQHASTGNSYAMPKSKTRHRAKSEPEMEGGGETGESQESRRRGGGNNGQPRYYYKNMGGPRESRGRTGHNHHSNPAAAKHRDTSSRGRGVRGVDQNGYKSDTQHTMKTNVQQRDRSRQKSSNNKDGRERQQQPQNHHRERGKSEEPRYHNNKNHGNRGGGGENERGRRTREKPTHSREHSRDNRERESSNKRRGRATSAPARYSSKSDKYKEDMRGSYDRYTSSNSNSLPKEFFCPLTKRLMKDPVKDTEGNTYEREAIERWLRVQSSSPITNRYLSLGMIRPDKELKRAIYKRTGKPRSKSQARTKSPPSQDLVSGRVLIDSYLREISSKSTLSISLDGLGICAFSYRRITFVIEVPITPNAGFMVYSSFDGEADKYKLSEKVDAWNKWFQKIGRHSRVSHVKAGQKTVFTLKGSESDMSKCDVFQRTLEYFVEMSLKLHNLIHPMEAKTVEKVCLTRTPVAVT